MYEDKRAHDATATQALQFVALTLPNEWQDTSLVEVREDGEVLGRYRARPCVARALRRAAVLQPLGLCSRVDVDVQESADPEIGLEIVAVYWEG